MTVCGLAQQAPQYRALGLNADMGGGNGDDDDDAGTPDADALERRVVDVDIILGLLLGVDCFSDRCSCTVVVEVGATEGGMTQKEKY